MISFTGCFVCLFDCCFALDLLVDSCVSLPWGLCLLIVLWFGCEGGLFAFIIGVCVRCLGLPFGCLRFMFACCFILLILLVVCVVALRLITLGGGFLWLFIW